LKMTQRMNIDQHLMMDKIKPRYAHFRKFYNIFHQTKP
jgi:hypothetical protein